MAATQAAAAARSRRPAAQKRLPPTTEEGKGVDGPSARLTGNSKVTVRTARGGRKGGKKRRREGSSTRPLDMPQRPCARTLSAAGLRSARKEAPLTAGKRARPHRAGGNQNGSCSDPCTSPNCEVVSCYAMILAAGSGGGCTSSLTRSGASPPFPPWAEGSAFAAAAGRAAHAACRAGLGAKGEGENSQPASRARTEHKLAALADPVVAGILQPCSGAADAAHSSTARGACESS